MFIHLNILHIIKKLNTQQIAVGLHVVSLSYIKFVTRCNGISRHLYVI